MEYCPSCGRVLGEVDFKLCPYCGTELKERVGRQAIPVYLRHKVFERDNYRCVECGATNKETTLEIDYVIPVAKGGTNDMENLQTLCKECNRAKSATVWEDNSNSSFIELREKEISDLEDQINDLNNINQEPLTDDEKIEIKFQIQINEEQIEEIRKEINQFKIEEEKRKKEELLFKKLYIEDSEILSGLFHYFKVPSDLGSKDEKIRYLIENCSEESINGFLMLYGELYVKDYRELSFLYSYFKVPSDLGSKDEKIRYLIENCSEESINGFLMLYDELYVKDYRELSFFYSYFKVPSTLITKDDRIRYLVENYSEEEIHNSLSIRPLFNKISQKNSKELSFLCSYFKVPSDLGSKDEKIRYLAENYSENDIENSFIRYLAKNYSKKDIENSFYPLYGKLYDKPDYILEKLYSKFNVPSNLKSKEEKLVYILRNYSEREITNYFKFTLYQKL